MQFTPQQLAGAGRYSAKTRIGNWHEDVQLEETKFADYSTRKAKGKLSTTFKQQKSNTVNQTVPMSYSKDGKLRFGDTVTIEHCLTGGTLASDLWDEISFGSREYSVTVCNTPSDTPVARNTFVITRVKNDQLKYVSTEDYNKDEVLNYGEPFQLVCNPSLLIDSRTNMIKKTNVPVVSAQK